PSCSSSFPYTTLFRSGFFGSGFELDFHRDLAVDRKATAFRARVRDADVGRQTKNLAAACHGRENLGATTLGRFVEGSQGFDLQRSEEHTSELQSRENL